MRHRLILVAAAAATLLAPASASAWTTKAQPGKSLFEAATVFPPRVLTAPVVSGTTREGETLTTTTGTYARGTTSLKVEWLRCDDAGSCPPVSTGTTRVLTAADVGFQMRSRVTATNDGGSTAALSARTATVTAAPAVNTTPPGVAGSTTVDELLIGDAGVWSHPDPSPTYRWLRCTTSCVPIANETGMTLLLTGADAGATIKFEVTHGGVTATSPPTTAVARGTYTHILCANPATGVGVGPDGSLPDGFTHSDSFVGIDANPASATRCAGSGAGIPVSTGGTFTTTTPDDRTSIFYRTPANVDFVSAQIYRQGQMSGRWSWAIQNTSATNLYSVRFELCSWGDGCFMRGVASPRFSSQNRVGIPYSATNGFNVTVACDIGAGSQCNADGSQLIRLFGGTAALRDTSSPRVTAAPSGSLASDATLSGNEALNLAAADDGAGLYRVRIRLDDDETATRVVSANNGRCADSDPGNGDAYEFAYQRPCVASSTSILTFDTSSWPRGSHRMRVLLEDAGRNTTLIVDRKVTL
jgi:hypothetical protein